MLSDFQNSFNSKKCLRNLPQNGRFPAQNADKPLCKMLETSVTVQTNTQTNSKRYIYTLRIGMCGFKSVYTLSICGCWDFVSVVCELGVEIMPCSTLLLATVISELHLATFDYMQGNNYTLYVTACWVLDLINVPRLWILHLRTCYKT